MTMEKMRLAIGTIVLAGCVGGSLFFGLETALGMENLDTFNTNTLLQLASAREGGKDEGKDEGKDQDDNGKDFGSRDDRGRSGAKGDRQQGSNQNRPNNRSGSQRGLEPVTHAQYTKECGSCHFAYQPGLLPARSWEKMLAGLDNHFGDNASLEAAIRTDLAGYLTAKAADRSNYSRSIKIMRSIRPEETPLRITETRYFTNQHQEIPRRLWADNPEVKSLIRCETCHPDATKGSYNEHAVRIPGHGRWQD
ncbi:MAG: diheme cytochrome c [Magnetococcus sp. DMHC-1]|nr:diheme cytochrome c [Magnetococcales bacterium]